MTVLKNTFFLVPVLIFSLNQYLEKVHRIFIPFIHSYLDDLLAMPVILGITLQLLRWIHHRPNSVVFTTVQITVGTVYISFLFEVFLPYLSTRYIADPWDVVCYGLGAVYFYFFINRRR